MRHFRTPWERAALAATVVGVVLFLVVGYRALSDDSPSTDPATGPAQSIDGTAPGAETGEQPDSSASPALPGGGDQPTFGTSGKDPFDNMVGSTQVYHVTINLRTDGQMKFVYRYRTGYTNPKTASGSVSVSKQIRGPRAVAQVFVQLTGGTYATCSITIDGKTVSTTSAKKMYDVVACTG